MASRKPVKKSRWASEAAQQALLRFGPEISGLRSLQRTAEDTYAGTVAAARGSSRDIRSAIGQLRPQLASTFDEAGLRQAAIATTPLHDLQALGDVAAPIKQGAALESAVFAGNLNSMRTAALTDLSQQSLAAAQAPAFAERNARRQLVKDLTSVLQRRQDLAKERGTFQALTTSQLTDAARQRALKVRIEKMGNATTLKAAGSKNSQSERNSIRSAGFDPDKPLKGGGYAPLPGAGKNHGKVSATGVKLHTSGEHQTAKDTVAKAISALATLDPDRTDRHGTAPLLVSGHKSQQLYDTVPAPTTTNPKATKQVPRMKGGIPLQTPDVPGVGSWATIAADVYYDGHLSRANQKALANQGYSLHQLGLPTYAEWKKAGSKAPPNKRAQALALTKALAGGLARIGG